MSLKLHVKSGTLLSVGGVVAALSVLARNIIVARMISVENFGIAATFGITIALIEMSTGLAVDRMIIQARDGNEKRLQATVHAFNVVRGLLLGTILYFVAVPVAHLFNIPEVTWAFQLLAAIPVITGFTHMDQVRNQREMNFIPSILVDVLPKLAALFLAAPLAIYYNDYRVMLFLIIIGAILSVLISFIMARRKYVLAWDFDVLKRMFSFGWPLMLNGILLFAIFQADRGLVGVSFGMKDLGWFSAAFTITLLPSMILAKICRTFFMPLLSNLRDENEQFQIGAIETIKVCILFGVLLTVGLSISGPALILLLFGEKYIEATSIVALLSLMQGIRTTKAGSVIVAISKGQTKIPLYANLARSVGIVAAVIIILNHGDIFALVLAGVGGETLAVVAILLLIRSKLKVDVTKLYSYIGLSVAIVLLTLVVSGFYVTGSNPIAEILSALIAGLVVIGLSVPFLKNLVGWLKRNNHEVSET